MWTRHCAKATQALTQVVRMTQGARVPVLVDSEKLTSSGLLRPLSRELGFQPRSGHSQSSPSDSESI